ncbi:hypothetical protein B0T11DRAFT_142650 [Plectosphaerella cucumerina]|uniref:Uncharacterized protein n=1 Tax=Plectosphaerella cucumerina TaxID=40658 RepID=A0A8K0T4S4_9PEZI|nr:hypothetical protein B0T11DRAFT_142650 [Plectosphaerella cucumerina]
MMGQCRTRLYTPASLDKRFVRLHSSPCVAGRQKPVGYSPKRFRGDRNRMKLATTAARCRNGGNARQPHPGALPARLSERHLTWHRAFPAGIPVCPRLLSRDPLAIRGNSSLPGSLGEPLGLTPYETPQAGRGGGRRERGRLDEGSLRGAVSSGDCISGFRPTVTTERAMYAQGACRLNAAAWRPGKYSATRAGSAREIRRGTVLKIRQNSVI